MSEGWKTFIASVLALVFFLGVANSCSGPEEEPRDERWYERQDEMREDRDR